MQFTKIIEKNIRSIFVEKCWWWWWIVFVVWLTDKRRFALFPPGTIVRDPNNRRYPTCRVQVWEPESQFRLCWMKLCSSDNQYTTAPQKCVGGTIPRPSSKKSKLSNFWINSFKLYAVCVCYMPSRGLSKYIETKLQTIYFYLR